MKAYYELSYIDSFGHGTYEYFYCTEEQIKQKAKELFEKEIEYAVDEEKAKESGMRNKPFEFDNDDCKGYIVKEVGFILSHDINWKLLDIDTNNRNVRNIYILTNQGHWATSEYLGVYTNLKEAKKQLKLKLDKPNELATTGEDDERLPNGICKKTDFGYSCSYYYWAKTSYEYDEWDIQANTNILTKKDIIKLVS